MVLALVCGTGYVLAEMMREERGPFWPGLPDVATFVDDPTTIKRGATRKSSPVSGKGGAAELNNGLLIDEEQGKMITLTLAEVSTQKIEKWIRTAGSVNRKTGRVHGRVYGKDARLVTTGQRTRIFPLVGREPVLQGKVLEVSANGDEVMVESDLHDNWYGNQKFYVMEIIVDFGGRLAIPNEAIIEEEGRKVVYALGGEGRYFQREINTGQRGELYTEILHGLTAGEKVVTFGSFFIDAQYKLFSRDDRATKGDGARPKGGKLAHRHH